jgi:tetratricopeptide (TPR) repeat protein
MKQSIRHIAKAGIVVLLMLPVAGCAMPLSSELRGLFAKANEAFSKGDYVYAVEGYTALLERNVESGNLYYNLGNAYSKLGKLGKAIVNYRRAQRFIPRDSDCAANLAFALSLRENPIQAPKRFWFTRLCGTLTLDETTLLDWLLYAMATALLSVRAWRRRNTIIAAVILLAVAVAAWGMSFYMTRIVKDAVVVVPSAESKFAPSEKAVTYFKVYEGTTVTIIGSTGQWVRVKTPDAKIGWVDSAAVERI